ncbi:MAG TPA: ATP phosphoribosyltransferase [Caulobacteraceae bacterium]|jgi:ATP phosphoribosyltransferase
MSDPLIIAIPSKGRLKEQVDAWLADCGLPVRTSGGDRGYSAALEGLDDVQVRLASAGDIAASLTLGDVHLGVTGEDLLREQPADGAERFRLLTPLGFGRADLVVAAPKSWIDVETMADVEDVAHLYLARTGRRLRVATKYLAQTRAFFARHGIVDYRITESGGATEGAPAAGAAELVVDITTTGATLAANGLKILSDGLILRSQAHLAAALGAKWSPGQRAACRRLLSITSARARGRSTAVLAWPASHDAAARAALAGPCPEADATGAHGAIIARSRLFDAADALACAGVGPISVTRPEYLFESSCAAADGLDEVLAAGATGVDNHPIS